MLQCKTAQHQTNQLRGFTLIELLVVISIIALLIGLLLPALGRARSISQQGVCLAQQRQATVGQTQYSSENDDWLAGPNTSGAHIQDFSDFGSAPTEPTQNVDWISPTLAYGLGLPGLQTTDSQYGIPARRLRVIFQTAFACPSNKQMYDYIYPGGSEFDGLEPGELRIASYSAAIGFHYTTTTNSPLNTDRWPEMPVDLRGYRPQITNVGRAEMKVCSMDGTRYVSSDYRVSFNRLPFQIRGGNFMTPGPATAGNSGDPHTLGRSNTNFTNEERDVMRRVAYRHSDGMVTSFYDGHAGFMTEEDSRSIDYWYPSGSRVIRSTLDESGPRWVN